MKHYKFLLIMLALLTLNFIGIMPEAYGAEYIGFGKTVYTNGKTPIWVTEKFTNHLDFEENNIQAYCAITTLSGDSAIYLALVQYDNLPPARFGTDNTGYYKFFRNLYIADNVTQSLSFGIEFDHNLNGNYAVFCDKIPQTH